jgi:RecB family exonuclease
MLTAEWVTYGGGATERLRAGIAAAQRGDPLQPVTVVTPSPGAAIVLRRRLGRDGMAAVTFLALEQLAELLAARPLARAGRPVIVPELVTAGVRLALAGHTGALSEVADHPATEECLAEVVLDLSVVPEHDRRQLPGRLEGLPAEVASVAVAALDALAGHALDADLFAEATAEVGRRPEVADPLGSVIVYLPGRVPPPHAGLLRAVAAITDVTVLAGRSGVPDADEASEAALAAVGAGPSPPGEVTASKVTSVIAANDVDDEVRTVLRQLMALVDAGTPVHRIALLYSAADPYARTIADQLRAAGVPFSAPSTDTLATAVAGRTLLGALRAVARRCERDAVIDLLSQAPVLAPDGFLAPVSRWDTVSRRAGVIAGPNQWQQRLHRYAEWRQRQAEEPHTETDLAGWCRQEAKEAHRLADFVEGLVAMATGPPLLWTEVGEWVHTILLRLLGPPTHWVSAPSHELDARTAVEEAIERLSVLATLEPNPTEPVVRRTIEAALDVPAPRRATAGHGMIVGPVAAGPGLDVDAVAVVGLAEGMLPRPAREGALLTDDARRHAGLPPSRAQVADQHRALLAALAGGAHHRIVAWSRGDQRAGRTRIPSRWLIDLVEPLLSERPTSRALTTMTEDPSRPWLSVSESFTAGLASVGTPRDGAPTGPADGELAHVTQHVERGGRLRDHPLAGEPVLEAAIELVECRRSPAFTRFDGNLMGHPVTIDASRPLSPTSMETWATCPRSYLFTRVLEVHDVDRPEKIDQLEATDKGLVAHAVLETIVREAIGAGAVPAPGEPWPLQVHDRVEQLVDAELAELEARGRGGHHRYRSHERRTLIAALQRALRHDAAVRARDGVTPVAVEMAFGTSMADALTITLPGGQSLPFRGYIDRVDRGEGIVSVFDYKTGSRTPFKDLDADDPVQGGRRLQLGIYALAARQRYGDARVTSEYWFTKHSGPEADLKGFELGPDQEDALLHVLDRIVAGIKEGVFPARPGEHLYHLGTFESCLFCDLDRLCSPERAEEWDLKRHAPALADYRTLAEGDDGDGAEGEVGDDG